MARPDSYWHARLLADRKLADRAAEEVAREVHDAMRNQYMQVARRLDELHAEVQARGTLSRTKLWNYHTYRALEAELAQYSEAGSMIQREALTAALDRVFEDVIGAPVERFNPKSIILPYSPRAFIDTAWSGEHFSSRIWKHTERLAEQIRTEAQLVVQGLKSTGQVKRELMKAYDVSFHQAERLIDTEISYVLNKAKLEDYRRRDRSRVTIVNLDVNTCAKCKALEGKVFSIDDAPVLPIHPRCHCAYCVPEGGNAAEITASGSDLASVYADAGVKGYERVPADEGGKITFGMAEIRRAPEVSVPTAGGVQDITAVYRERATPGIGEILRETGYREDKHRAEIADAELLFKELGGMIHLRAERNGPNEKTPDYTWNGKDWEQKTVSGTTSIDNAIRKGAKQISENPGGIVLNMGESKTNDEDAQAAIRKRFKRVALRTMEVVIIRRETISRILRLTKD